MNCKIKLEIIKLLTLEFELSTVKKEKEDVKKELPPPATPSK